MAGIIGKRPSEGFQINKSGLSEDRRTKLLPSGVGLTYDSLRFEGYLGNVGENDSFYSMEKKMNEHNFDIRQLMMGILGLVVLADGKVEPDQVDSLVRVHNGYYKPNIEKHDAMHTINWITENRDKFFLYLKQESGNISAEDKELLIGAGLAVAMSGSESMDVEAKVIYEVGFAMGINREDIEKEVDFSIEVKLNPLG